MKAYSTDSRKKIVEAKQRGLPTVEVARTFGVGISSVKRYVKTARKGESLRPKRSPGRRPKADQRARRLLEADLKERPAATLSERRQYLSSVAGLRVSESTISRLLRRMGFSRKKIGRCERTRRVLEGRLAGARHRRDDTQRLVFVDECGANTSLATLHAWSRRGERALAKVPRNWGSNVTLLASMSVEGIGRCLAVEGSTTKAVFETYLECVLVPSLRPGQQVMVMDNLSAHKGSRVREFIEGRSCELMYLPRPTPQTSIPSRKRSPSSKLACATAARSREALIEAMGAALDAITAGDAHGFFGGCGYRTPAQPL